MHLQVLYKTLNVKKGKKKNIKIMRKKNDSKPLYIQETEEVKKPHYQYQLSYSKTKKTIYHEG